jgi:hypothetical protein
VGDWMRCERKKGEVLAVKYCRLTPTFFSLFRWFSGVVAVMECYWGIGFRAGQARGLDFSSLRPLPSLLIVAMPLASLIFCHLIPMWRLWSRGF